ncbi:hypothetical protein KIPB_002609, partial [Kipferlia bialata]
KTSLLNCVFVECALNNVTSTTGATMVNVAFRDCNQTGMVLKGCRISGENRCLPLEDKTNRHFSAEDLEGVDVGGWDMTGCTVTGCDLTAVRGMTVGHIGSLSALTQCTLRGMDLTGLDLRDTDAAWSDFSGADLARCDVTGATLTGCDLSGANLTGVRGLTERQLEGVKSVRGVTVSGVDMRGWDLKGLDLRDADLSGCQMGDATVEKSGVEGAALPKGDQAPIVEMDPRVRFEFSDGETEDTVGRGILEENDNRLRVTLIVPPSLHSQVWTLEGSGDLSLRVPSETDRDFHLLEPYDDDTSVTCVRAGNAVFLHGQRGRYAHQCIQGEEARVVLAVDVCDDEEEAQPLRILQE